MEVEGTILPTTICDLKFLISKELWVPFIGMELTLPKAAAVGAPIDS